MEPVKCAICKRTLTGKSRLVGIGPTCRRKNPALAHHLISEFQGQMQLIDRNVNAQREVVQAANELVILGAQVVTNNQTAG